MLSHRSVNNVTWSCGTVKLYILTIPLFLSGYNIWGKTVFLIHGALRVRALIIEITFLFCSVHYMNWQLINCHDFSLLLICFLLLYLKSNQHAQFVLPCYHLVVISVLQFCISCLQHQICFHVSTCLRWMRVQFAHRQGKWPRLEIATGEVRGK